MAFSKILLIIPLLAITTFTAQAITVSYNLNVEIIQVLDDSGSNGTPLLGSDGGSYIYSSQVNDIWNQAGIQVSFTNSTWNNTEAQRLDSTERTAIYNNTFAAGTGDSLPGLATDSLQIFFVMDHSGTGYNGTAGSGWVGSPLSNPSTSARNAGNNQLGISGFTSNGRGLMANEGFAADSLSGTIAHEIGHAMGLRHVENVNGGAGNGTVQDPNYTVGLTTPNLMWGAGSGPSYSGSLDLQQNFDLNQEQIDAAIFNGLDLDPDGNGTGVLQLIPEPSSTSLIALGGLALLLRRKRTA